MITALLLGLAGSVHCAGMCGPLVLLTPVAGNTRSAILTSRLLYHAGRITTYAAIGLIFGLVGESIAMAGFQRWISLIVGILMLLSVLASAPLKSRVTRFPRLVKSLFGILLRRRTFLSIFTLGATNGLLPCGLVYIAATASIAAGSATRSIAYMLLFGFGTFPILLTIALAQNRALLSRIPALQKLTPITIAAVAIFQIARADPISLLSNTSSKPSCPACAKSRL